MAEQENAERDGIQATPSFLVNGKKIDNQPYADFKKLDIGKISVEISHSKIHAKDCLSCTEDEKAEGGKIDVFERRIEIAGLEDEELKKKMLEIADKCPVHKTLEKGAKVETVYRK